MLIENKVAGEYVVAIRLLDFEERDGIVFLNVQELIGDRKYTLSSNMNYQDDMWMWSLADFETLTVVK